jgi:hypothetical protein
MPETAERRQGKIQSELPINHHWRKNNMPLDTQLMNTELAARPDTGPHSDSIDHHPVRPNMNTDIAAQKALDRLAKNGFEKLAGQEKILAAVWTFAAGVANRGFARYFSSPAGDMAFYAPTALKAIGARGMAELAAKANTIFGAGGPPKDRKARRERVRALGGETKRLLEALETRYYESQEDVDDLLEAYLDKK